MQLSLRVTFFGQLLFNHLKCPAYFFTQFRKLSREQRSDLKKRLDAYRPDQVIEPELRISQGQFWTVSDLSLVVERWYAVSYRCRDSYVALLHECRFSQQQTERVYRSQPDVRVVADFEAWLEKK